MSKLDDKYQLRGCVEFDERYFQRIDNEVIFKEKESENTEVSITTKQSSGIKKQAKVLVMAESEPTISEPKKGKPNRKAGYLKMVVLEDLKSDTIYANQGLK